MMRMRRRLGKLKRLSRAQWGMLLRVTPLIIATRGALAVLPFRSVVQYVESQGSNRSGPALPAGDVPHVLWATHAVGNRLLRGRACLTQALVAKFLLARRGVPAALRIGVAKDREKLAAHAWIEQDGRVLIGGETSPQRFKALPELRL
jgi:hypothetical protein